MIGHHDVARLTDAAIEARTDPDAIPLVIALLERAVQLAANPPKRRVRATPDTRHFTTGY